MREYNVYMDESYKEYMTSNDKYMFDEWGCAEVVDEEKGVGVSYNFSYDQGESCCAIYPMFRNENGEYWEDDCYRFRAYDIDFDDPDWKAKLEKEMNGYLDEIMGDKE